MKAVTRTGTTVNRFQIDVISVTLGSNLGITILPLKNLIIVIPAVITRNTTASATAKADEYLSESASMKSMSLSSQTRQQCRYYKNARAIVPLDYCWQR